MHSGLLAHKGKDAKAKTKYFSSTDDRSFFGARCAKSQIHCQAKDSTSQNTQI